MGVARTPGSRRSRPVHHSIRFTFVTTVIVPVVCLVAVWALLVAFVPGGGLAGHGSSSSGHHGFAEVAVQAGGGLIVVVAAAVLMSLFTRRLTREVTGLAATARHTAEAELPRLLANLRGEELPGGDSGFTPPPASIGEIAGATAAISALRQAAVAAAADEASLRKGIGQVFVSLARRNQSLLQRQLHLIDTLEQKSTEPDELAELFSLDHLTTRMRRHAENLLVLSGASPGRSWSQPVPVIDVVRGAMAEVEDYQRVRVLSQSQDAIIGSAAADLIHLLAELIENATMFSPSGTEIDVRAERVTSGFVIEIEDRGLGVQPELLSEINQKLLRPPDFTVAEPDRLGLFVVGRLAARHGARVSLTASPHGGTTAVVMVPPGIVVAAAPARSAGASGEMPILRPPQPPAGPSWRPQGRHDRRERPSQDAFALTQRRTVRPASPVEPPPAPLVEAPLTPPDEPAGVLPAPTALDETARPRPADVPLPRRSGRASPDGGAQGSGQHRALPRRVRQANLSPHLKNSTGPMSVVPAGTGPMPSLPGTGDPAGPRRAAGPPAPERTPEAARDLVAAFRAGWQREMPAAEPGVTQTPQKTLPTSGPESALPQRSSSPKTTEQKTTGPATTGPATTDPKTTEPKATEPPLPEPPAPGQRRRGLRTPQQPPRGQRTAGPPPPAGQQTAAPTAAPQEEETQWKSGARQEPEQT